MMKIHICNNDNNGNWTNRFSMVEFFDDERALVLETNHMHDVTAKYFDPRMMLLEIYGITVKFNVVGTWTGNMKWNTIEMLDYYALGFLRALQLSREWCATEGWTLLFNKFEDGEIITGADFELDEDVQPRVVHPNQLQIPF
jgi:hypothetical protein